MGRERQSEQDSMPNTAGAVPMQGQQGQQMLHGIYPSLNQGGQLPAVFSMHPGRTPAIYQPPNASQQDGSGFGHQPAPASFLFQPSPHGYGHPVQLQEESRMPTMSTAPQHQGFAMPPSSNVNNAHQVVMATHSHYGSPSAPVSPPTPTMHPNSMIVHALQHEVRSLSSAVLGLQLQARG